MISRYVPAIAAIAFGCLTSCTDTTEVDGQIAVPANDEPPVDGWPELHGPRRDSTSTETGFDWNWPAEGPKTLWETDIGKGYSAPVLWEDRLVVYHRIADEERLDCLEADTGEPQWRKSFPTTYASDVEYSDGPYATPALTADSAVVLSAEGRLRKLDLTTGEPLWERSLASDYAAQANTFAVGTSPLVEENLVVVNIGGTKENSGVVAVDFTSGETVWTATSDGDSYATPRAATIGGERFLFVLTDASLVALDPSDGRIRWQTPWALKGGSERVTAVSPLVCRDLVIVTAGPGAGVLAVRVLPGDRFEEVWRDRRALDSQFNNLTTDGVHVFGFTSMWNRQAELRCLDVETGDVMWGWDSDLQRGSSILVDGKLLLLGEHGHLAVVEASNQVPTPVYLSPEPVIDGPAFTAPALHRGRLYLRNERELKCLELPRAK